MADVDGRPLAELQWVSRAVVVLARTPGNALLDQQQELLLSAGDGLAERDLVTVVATDSGVSIDGVERTDLKAERLKRAYGAPASLFQVLLIGKDGGVKLRSSEPVAAAELFALIDTMPMRRREMRDRPAG